MKVADVSQIRALDRTAIEAFGISDQILMENAGHAVYHVLSREIPVEGSRFAVFCGTGNNAGDGLVVARKLHSNGGRVGVFALGAPDRLKGAARRNLDIAGKLNIRIQPLASIQEARCALEGCDAVVDAIFGTGLIRKVEGLHLETIRKINESGKPVFSVDIPSGVHGDTGQTLGGAVRAAFTVTLGLPKIGNLLPPGSDLYGIRVRGEPMGAGPEGGASRDGSAVRREQTHLRPGADHGGADRRQCPQRRRREVSPDRAFRVCRCRRLVERGAEAGGLRRHRGGRKGADAGVPVGPRRGGRDSGRGAPVGEGRGRIPVPDPQGTGRQPDSDRADRACRGESCAVCLRRE